VDYERKVIPVITGVTGTISKSFRKYLSNKPGSTNIKAQNIQHEK
jgi:RNase P/RNase MRP subunit POP5